MMRELGFNFEFRTSSPNEVSTDYMGQIEQGFYNLSYPYVLKSNPGITILNFWTCYKRTKYIYQRVRFRIKWDDSKGGADCIKGSMKNEFSGLGKAYVIYTDPVNKPSPCECLSGYALSSCGKKRGISKLKMSTPITALLIFGGMVLFGGLIYFLRRSM